MRCCMSPLIWTSSSAASPRQSLSRSARSRGNSVAISAPREAETFAHADDLVGRQRARAQAAFVAAAVHLRLEPHPRVMAHVQRADALRPVGLVRGERHQIDRLPLEIDRDLAGRLRRVDVEDDAAFAADRAERADILNDADLVVDQHHRRDNGVGTDRRFELLDVEQPVGPRREKGHLEAVTLELVHGVEHRFVLGLQRDQMPAPGLAGKRRALDRKVVGFGRTRSPDDLARIGVDELVRPGRARPRPRCALRGRKRASCSPDCRTCR